MRHIPVLLNEVLRSLQLKPGMKIIDATLGDAGHSEAILEGVAPTGQLLGLDADPEALLRAKRFLYRFESRVTLVRENFARLKTIAEQHDFFPVNGILFDLGWSTPQFTERGRGFSFEGDEPIDMRYGGEEVSPGVMSTTAADILNNYSVEDLTKIFHIFGEEKFSHSIAEQIAEERRVQPFFTTKQLTETILRVYRQKLHSTQEIPWTGRIHPATKVFQALRIEVNQELRILKEVLPQAFDLLAAQGRLAVITFHSLEDRIVKHYFQSLPKGRALVVTKSPLVPSIEELRQNPRSRSAKFRVIEKL